MGDGGGWGLPQETEVRVCPHLSGIARDQPRTWMDALSLPAPFICGSSDRARLGRFHSGGPTRAFRSRILGERPPGYGFGGVRGLGVRSGKLALAARSRSRTTGGHLSVWRWRTHPHGRECEPSLAVLLPVTFAGCALRSPREARLKTPKSSDDN